VPKGGERGVIFRTADLVAEGVCTTIENIRDESDRRGMRIVMELYRGSDPDEVVAALLAEGVLRQRESSV